MKHKTTKPQLGPIILPAALRESAAIPPPFTSDRALRVVKRLLMKSAADPADTEWRLGYDEALKMVLLDLGIDCTYQPARYTFSDETTEESTND